ncbi:MAG: hemerythrin domain-containing protein [Candidatus Binataceae bacterium]
MSDRLTASETIAPSHGPIHRFLCGEHARLDRLLDAAQDFASSSGIAAYAQFRHALLRHISMEEKVLLPDAEKRRGAPHPLAARLRLDHGAMAALMMPSASRAILRTLRTILIAHNPLEESPGGVYDACEQLAGADAARLLSVIEATAEVPVKPHLDTEKTRTAVRHALERAGYDPHLLDE